MGEPRQPNGGHGLEPGAQRREVSPDPRGVIALEPVVGEHQPVAVEFERIAVCQVSLARQLRVDRDLAQVMLVVQRQDPVPHLGSRVEVERQTMGPPAGDDEQVPQQRQRVDLGVGRPRACQRAPRGFAYSCSARLNMIQLVAMYLSPPFGMLPRWVWVNAVGAINSEPAFGAMRRFWYRNSVSPSRKPSFR